MTNNSTINDYVGILLVGGTGKRLAPTTYAINKHLLPVYDKPMIYYSLSLLMLLKISNIIIVCRPEDEIAMKSLLGDGAQWGINLSYTLQKKPNGIAEAIILCAPQIADKKSVLLLGDNIIHGANLGAMLSNILHHNEGASILGYPVSNPSAYGVVELDENNNVNSLEEKPASPRSNLAVPGFYCYDNKAPDLAKTLTPSSRGELEITDLNRLYLSQNKLKAYNIGRGIAWLDGGTVEDLFEASLYVRTMQKRTGSIISSPEEIAYNNGWISQENLLDICQKNINIFYYQKLYDGIFS